MLKVAWTLLKRKLGFRSLLDVIALDASLVKGSHGRVTDDPRGRPAVHQPASRSLLPAGAGWRPPR